MVGKASKVLHVLGGGEWQLPTIMLAKSLGWHVFVTDGAGSCPGYRLADSHEAIDITDAEATLEASRRHGISGILCDTTDVGVPTMAYVAEKLRLPGIGQETALNFTNKARMREHLSARGLPCPAFRQVANAGEAERAATVIGYPCVIKPTSSQSSRGVSIIRSQADVAAAYAAARAASKIGGVLVEAFIRGQEYTVEGYCVDGQATIVAVSDKDHFRGLSAVAHRLTYPAALSDRQMSRVQSQHQEIIIALGLDTGVFHAEYMIAGEDVTLVEIAARGAGSYVYSDIVSRLANHNVMESYMRYAMGEGWARGPELVPEDKKPEAANLAFFGFPPGLVTAIRGLEAARAIPGVSRVLIETAPGQALAPIGDDRSRHGLMVCFGRTRADVLAATERVYNLVELKIDGVWRKGSPQSERTGLE